MSRPRVAVCIPTHERSAELAGLLDTLGAQTYPRELLDVVVHDDASGPDEASKTKAAVERFGGKLVRSEQNVKMLAGRNRAVAAAPREDEYFLFVDDDGLLEPDTLERLMTTMLERPEAGAVGPRMVSDAPERPLLHPAAFLRPWTGTYRMQDGDAAFDCDWLNTTCILVRRTAFEAAGGFDESFLQSQAEADLCLKMKAAGYSIVYEPRVQARHRIEVGQQRRHRLYHVYRNKFWVLRRHFHGPRKLTALAFHAVFGTARHLLDSLAHGFDPAELALMVRATWDGIFAPLRP